MHPADLIHREAGHHGAIATGEQAVTIFQPLAGTLSTGSRLPLLAWSSPPGPAVAGRHSSRSARTSPTQPRSGSTGTSGPSGQAAKAGLGFSELSNGFASCDGPAALQEIWDRLQPGTIELLAQRWLYRLPMPFTCADQRAGYWWEISVRQVEVSGTLVFGAPRRARAFFEALIADNLDIGRPANVEIIFSRHIRRDAPGVFCTTIDRPDVGPIPAGSCLTCPASTRGLSSTSKTAGRCGSRPLSTPPRPGLQRPAAEPRRTPGQSPHLRPAHTGS